MKLLEKIKTFFFLIIILLGLFAIVLLIPLHIAIGLISLTFGILAIIWTSKAFWNLSEGSSLKTYAFYFLISLTLIFINSIWQVLGRLFHLEERFVILEAICITAAYLLFVVAAYKLSKIGQEFGFRWKAKKIKQLIKK